MRATSKSLEGRKWPAGRVLNAPGLYRHFVSIGSFFVPQFFVYSDICSYSFHFERFCFLSQFVCCIEKYDRKDGVGS